MLVLNLNIDYIVNFVNPHAFLQLYVPFVENMHIFFEEKSIQPQLYYETPGL